MNDAIDSIRGWLADWYEELDLEFNTGEYTYVSNRVVFIPVDSGLNLDFNNVENALVLDPEIGVALYLFKYDEETDVRSQVAQAISYRSRLLRSRIDQQNADPYGSWRIVLHWFVPHSLQERWINSAARLRRDTAHLEEIPIDAIFLDKDDSGWYPAIERHGIPRLMLQTRKILRMSSDADVLNWSSADLRVRDALENIDKGFDDEFDKKHASSLVAWLADKSVKGEGQQKSDIKKLRQFQTIKVENFRNIDSLDMSFDVTNPTAIVVHGPNGAGKSNVLEAIEFALCGRSTRADKFIGDNDVPSSRRSQKYRQDYLKPIANINDPLIEIDGETISPLSKDKLPEIEASRSLGSNVLSQESSSKFVNMDARDLASQIQVGLSNLAYEAIEFVEGELEKARAGQRRLLSEHQLSSQITKTDTARKKAAASLLREKVAQPRSLTGWLQLEELAFSPTTENASKLAASLEAWENSVDSLANQISIYDSSVDIAEAIRSYLQEAWDSAAEAKDLLVKLEASTENWKQDFSDLVSLWGNWLETQATGKELPVADQDTKSMERQRAELERKLGEISRAGTLLSERETHFQKLEAFLKDWSKENPNKCPTCDSDLTTRGGISNIVEELRTTNQREREDLRKEYRATQDKLNSLLKELGQRAETKCPVSETDQERIREFLLPHIPSAEELTKILADPDKRSRLIKWILAVQRRPSIPSTITEDKREQTLESISEEIANTFSHIETTFASPESWSRVVKEVRSRLANVLDEHLPATIGSLWRELVLNLTPAQWQVPGTVSIALENRRGTNQARIEIDSSDRSRLARYVLNLAEIHALGLAWFFVRYITDGRFKRSFIALDDPAQEMDQTTYRDLCRLLESLIRLHGALGLPLSVLMLLHQDERALEATRATDAVLYRMNWNQGKAVFAERISLYSAEYRHPTPAVFLSSEESVAT